MQTIINSALLRAFDGKDELALWKRFWRYATLTPRDKREYILEKAENPQALADFLGYSPSDFIGYNLPWKRSEEISFITDDEEVCLVAGMIADKSDCVWLESEDEWAFASECVEVNVGRRGGRTEWRRETDDSFFRCEWSGEYFDSDNYTCVRVDGDDVCLERNEGDLYYWESDGEYHREPEPEDDNELGLMGYHNGKRSPVLPGEAMSLELEVLVGSPSSDFGDDVRKVADAAEEDGSLPENGAEIIWGSTLFTDLPAKADKVLAVLDEYDCKGHIDDSAGFGMHINVSRRGWGIGAATLARILLFVCENQAFFEGIAQRKEIHWAKYSRKTVGKAISALHSGEKYEAVACRSNDRLEFRLFRSSCRKDRILKNCEAVAAVIRFCKSIPNHKQLSLARFRDYLNENAKTYPHLVAFISEKSL